MNREALVKITVTPGDVVPATLTHIDRDTGVVTLQLDRVPDGCVLERTADHGVRYLLVAYTGEALPAGVEAIGTVRG